MKIEVGGIIFDDKKQLRRHVQAIVAETPLNDRVNAQYVFFLIALLERHDRAAEKIGIGVKTFKTIKNGYGNKALCVVRRDGTAVEFSWTKCIDGQTHQAVVKEAFRNEVFDQIHDFKFDALQANAHCAISGWPVNAGNCEVDHIAPDTFINLLKRFLGETIIDEIQVKHKKLLDRDMARRWWRFHKDNAKLQLLSRGVHREMSHG